MSGRERERSDFPWLCHNDHAGGGSKKGAIKWGDREEWSEVRPRQQKASGQGFHGQDMQRWNSRHGGRVSIGYGTTRVRDDRSFDVRWRAGGYRDPHLRRNNDFKLSNYDDRRQPHARVPVGKTLSPTTCDHLVDPRNDGSVGLGSDFKKGKC